jgi:hypothetical protein
MSHRTGLASPNHAIRAVPEEPDLPRVTAGFPFSAVFPGAQLWTSANRSSQPPRPGWRRDRKHLNCPCAPSDRPSGPLLALAYGIPAMSLIISVLITFLVIILILYLVNLLPIDGRAKQIVRVVVIVIGIISMLKYLAVF